MDIKILKCQLLFFLEVVIKIEVKDNNIEQALRVLKKKLQRDGFFKNIKLKNTYEKPSEKKKRIQQENIKFIKKSTLKWFRSSKRAKRGFCNKCGASIFFKVIGTKNISIAAGMFNKQNKLKTIMNIFTKIIQGIIPNTHPFYLKFAYIISPRWSY